MALGELVRKLGLASVLPTGMSDAQATALGLKQYLHGTAYNGGIAPDVTLYSGGGSLTAVNQAKFIPYQVQDGSWRLKFNINVTLSLVGRSLVTLSVAGVTFAASLQAFAATVMSGAAYYRQSCTVGGTGRLCVVHDSDNTEYYMLSGDVELGLKPTWAY